MIKEVSLTDAVVAVPRSEPETDSYRRGYEDMQRAIASWKPREQPLKKEENK